MMNKPYKRPQALLLALACALSSTVARAQTKPQEPSPPVEREARLAVKAISIQGNTLLPEAALESLVAPLVGGETTLAALKQAAAAVQQAYRRAGYGGVVAYLPEQNLAQGNVIIRVVEGKLARIRLSGNRRYDEANVRNSLPNLRLGQTPLVRAIDRDIQLVNENPVKELRVTLTAGARPGDIDANIEVVEDKPVRVFVGLDNTGTAGTGDYRLSIGAQHANLWNRDHIGTFQYQTSPTDPGLVHIYSLGYRLPLYDRSTSLDAFFAHSSVGNGTTITPAGPLQFTGRGDVVGLRANRYLPRLGEYDQRLTLGLDWRDYRNDCSVGTLGPAGCGTAAASVTVMPLSLAYTGQVQRPELSWGFSAAFAGNAGGSSQEAFEAARPGARKRYTVARLSAFGNRALAAGFGLAGRISAQYSPDALVPGEQLGLGGAAGVRGYRERELAGDYGYSLSVEALGPDFGKAFDVAAASARPLLFLDYGRVANHRDAPCARTDSSCSLAGAGLGLRLAYGKRFSGRLDVARALKDGIQTGSGGTRVHFALNLVF